jgi:integrase
MPVIKLTEKAITKLRAPDPSGKQMPYWDRDLKGFGLLVSGVTKSKSYVVQRALPDGRTRRITVGPTSVLSLDEAMKRAKEILAVFYMGLDPKAGVRGEATLRSALDDYLRVNANLRPRSVENYRAAVERHLDIWLDLPLRNVTRTMVEDRLRKIARDVAQPGRHSGSSSANMAMRVLRLLYNFSADRAPETKPMPPNPVRLRKAWLPVEHRTRRVEDDQLPAFYQAVTGLANAVARDYLLLLLFTGLRRSEAAALRWQHVDLPGRVIRLPASSTKGRRKLDLPMTDFVSDLLVARRALGDATFVFPSNSRTGHITNLKYFFRMLAAASGVEVSAHDLRRTFATVAENAEVGEMVLRALINHSLGKGVTSNYVQMTADRLRAPAQKVCDRLKALCGIAPVEGDKAKKFKTVGV